MAHDHDVDTAGMACHIVQRGDGGQPVLVAERDFARCREAMEEAARRHACTVHAWVLLTHRMHLLVTPSEAGALAPMMRMIRRHSGGRVDARRTRAGAPWREHFGSSCVAGDRRVLTCHHHIETRPTHAGIVAATADYRWSSHAVNALGQRSAFLVPHGAYLRLGRDDDERREAYIALFQRPSTPPRSTHRVHLHVGNSVTGDAHTT